MYYMQKKLKTNKPKYGKLPTKEVKMIPWVEAHINLIGPYTVKTTKLDSNGIPIELKLVAMVCINHVTGWFEIT